VRMGLTGHVRLVSAVNGKCTDCQAFSRCCRKAVSTHPYQRLQLDTSLLRWHTRRSSALRLLLVLDLILNIDRLRPFCFCSRHDGLTTHSHSRWHGRRPCSGERSRTRIDTNVALFVSTGATITAPSGSAAASAAGNLICISWRFC